MKNDVHEVHKWSDENTSVLDTDDWEIAAIRSLGGGVGVGAGYCNFAVRSLTLKVYARLVFLGGGVNLGTYGGPTIPPTVHYIDCSRVDWRSLRSSITEPFSLSNWCNSTGRLSVIALATPGKAGWGYMKMILTAEYNGNQRQGLLFDKYEYSGTGYGTGGCGLGVNLGVWRLLDVPKPHQLDSDWTKPVCKQ